VKPIVKWAGGKTQLLPTLLPLLAGGRLVEPFLGGAAAALARGGDCIVGDACEDLMEMYDQVRHKPLTVARVLHELADDHCEEAYYRVRARVPLWAPHRAARFLYLNKACFNGLYRVNRSGLFNVPFGRGAPAWPTTTQLMALSREAWRWSMECRDFEETIGYARRGDVVYADPPYDETFDYASGFGADDRTRLRAALGRARVRGARCVVTDADTPVVRELYKTWTVTEIVERRRIGATTREPAACLLIVGDAIR
jgi:DNA adenine methylase